MSNKNYERLSKIRVAETMLDGVIVSDYYLCPYCLQEVSRISDSCKYCNGEFAETDLSDYYII